MYNHFYTHARKLSAIDSEMIERECERNTKKMPSHAHTYHSVPHTHTYYRIAKVAPFFDCLLSVRMINHSRENFIFRNIISQNVNRCHFLQWLST